MFNSLSEKLESAFKNIKGQARITDLNIANTVKDIRRALVDADVNYKRKSTGRKSFECSKPRAADGKNCTG